MIINALSVSIVGYDGVRFTLRRTDGSEFQTLPLRMFEIETIIEVCEKTLLRISILQWSDYKKLKDVNP